MEEKLPPEIKELVDKVLSEHKAVKELSVEDLEGVAGGVPETFVVNGGSVTPAELYKHVRTVHEEIGTDVAEHFLETALESAGYPYIRQAIEAYRVYGENMWWRLAQLGK